MSHRHGKDREKKKKKSPPEKRKDVAEAVETLTNVNMAILCSLCEKTDCVNRFKCKTYETKESTDIVDNGEEIEEEDLLGERT